MLEHTFQRIRTVNDKADWNAFLESFCVHARNLKAFLTNDRGNANNGAIARDFIDSSRVRVPPDLTGAFQRLNEQSTHLSKNRPTEPAGKFTRQDAVAVITWLRSAMQAFIDGLPAEDKVRWNAAARDPNKVAITVLDQDSTSSSIVVINSTTLPPAGPTGPTGPLMVKF